MRKISVVSCLFLLSCLLPLRAKDFHWLVERGTLKEIRQALNGDARLATMKDELGRTPLQLAVIKGDLRLVNVLLNAGAEVNVADRLKGYCAIHYAALYKHAKITAFLLARRADLRVKDNEGNFPLHIAAANGCHEVVRILLEHRADPNAMNKFWQNPLHLCAKGVKNSNDFPFASNNESDYLKVVELLMKFGAYTLLRDYKEDTPAAIVMRNYQNSGFAQAMIRLLDLNKKGDSSLLGD
jgi:ankyrin repeat protein